MANRNDYRNRGRNTGREGYGDREYGSGRSGEEGYRSYDSSRNYGSDSSIGRGRYRSSDYNSSANRYGSGRPGQDWGSWSGNYGSSDRDDRSSYGSDYNRSYGGDYNRNAGGYGRESGGYGREYGGSYSGGYDRDETRGTYRSRGYDDTYSSSRGLTSRNEYGRSGDYDRNDDRNDYRDRYRSQYPESERGYIYGSQYDQDYDADQRGWWDKTSDEVASWFGDTDAERRREMDMRREGQHRGRGPSNYTRSDDRIREDINDKLTDNDFLDASDINVEVNNGDVILKGNVDSRYAKRLAEDIAEDVSGVKNVENRLRTDRQSSTIGETGSTANNKTANESSGTSTTTATGTSGSSGTAATTTGTNTGTAAAKGKSKTAGA